MTIYRDTGSSLDEQQLEAIAGGVGFSNFTTGGNPFAGFSFTPPVSGPAVGFGNGAPNYGAFGMGDAPPSWTNQSFGLDQSPPMGGLGNTFGGSTSDPFYNPSPPGNLAPYDMDIAGGIAPPDSSFGDFATGDGSGMFF